FEYGTNERPDLKGSYALKRIIIRYNINGTQSEITRYNLYQNDTGSSNLVCNAPNILTDNSLGSRIQLDSIKQSSIPSHKFYYNSRSLPARLSNQQDLWGFAN